MFFLYKYSISEYRKIQEIKIFFEKKIHWEYYTNIMNSDYQNK